MQHIGLRRETESGQLIAEFTDPTGLELRAVRLAPQDSLFLRFIDPHGDTVFNQMQIPELIAELKQFTTVRAEADLRENLAAVVEFLRASIGVHIYVRFLGD